MLRVPCPLRPVRCCAALCCCACVVLLPWYVLFLAPGAVVCCRVLCCCLWCSVVRCCAALSGACGAQLPLRCAVSFCCLSCCAVAFGVGVPLWRVASCAFVCCGVLCGSALPWCPAYLCCVPWCCASVWCCGVLSCCLVWFVTCVCLRSRTLKTTAKFEKFSFRLRKGKNIFNSLESWALPKTGKGRRRKTTGKQRRLRPRKKPHEKKLQKEKEEINGGGHSAKARDCSEQGQRQGEPWGASPRPSAPN